MFRSIRPDICWANPRDLVLAFQHKHKRSVSDAENSISQSDLTKRHHRTASETASTVSVCLPDDIISLAPSSSTASRAAFTQDFEFAANADVGQKISDASCQCVTELRSEGSWVIKVALSPVEGAVAELPLECWSIQKESVDPQYQPRYTARDSYHRKIDLVVGLPVNAWEIQYEKAGLHPPVKSFSHTTHPHTGKRVLGPGIEVKAADRNSVEASLQDLPPLIGCTAVGEDWKFYIAVGAEESGTLKEVRLWGPISDLDGHITSVKHITSLLRTLRRVMEYTIGHYKDGIFEAMTSR
ncbi:putative integral membrane protein [Penicillium digitatum]|uniref:Putative integral membrane protein n=1 Tax=Penicillium digitatum TaxID=36651 RepID=A0A7T6XM91_PENDI|nr:putative integral membrane protein [Penicillium digitatum]